MKRRRLKKLKWKWHLPKWAVDFPTPVKRSVNLADMGKAELHSLHRFALLVLMPLSGPGSLSKRNVYVWDLLYSINIVLRMSPLERLAHAGEPGNKPGNLSGNE